MAMMDLDRIKQMLVPIVDQFSPNSIYLFGSYAYGCPTPESDVDLLVVMPTEDAESLHNTAVQIRLAIRRSQLLMCDLDVVVRSTTQFKTACEQPEGFLSTIYTHGRQLFHLDHEQL
jgi:uncharacterized protein